MMLDLERMEMRSSRLYIEFRQRWGDEINRIPFIQFPADWKVQVIPPFGDAIVRFRVQLPSGATKSIYLDARNSLGYWGDPAEPYWEVFPYKDDVGRCHMDNTAALLEMIGEE